MINGALPTLADTDVADTLGAGADLSFDEGGSVPDAGTSWERDPVQAQAPNQTVPTPRRAPVREPEVPGRAPDALQPHPEDVAEGRLPTPAAEDTTWERDQPTWGEKLRTGARAFARGVIPNVSSIPAGVAGFGAGSVAGGALAGAATGALVPGLQWATVPLGALIGGLTVGGAAASMQAAGSRTIQDKLVPPSATEQAEEARNPGAATAGSIAAGGVGLSPYSGAKTILGQIAARGGQAAAQGGMDVGQQMAEGRPFDWQEAAGAAGLGALLPGFNRLGRGMTSLGEEGHAPAPQPAPAPGEPPIPLAVPVGKPYGQESTGYSPATPPNLGVDINGVPNPIGPQATPRASNQNAPFVPPEGPRAVGNDNTTTQPGVMPGRVGVGMQGVPNPIGPQAAPGAANTNTPPPFAGPRATQDNVPPVPPTPAQPLPETPAAQPDFVAQGAPDFTLNGGPEGSQTPRGPGSPEMPLSGEVLPPGAPDPWSSPQLGAQQIASLEGAQRPAQGAPSGGPGLPPPGQRSPGGGPPEGISVAGQAGRPDKLPSTGEAPAITDQSTTPVPGGYPGQSAGAAVPTKGARAVNVAPPPRPGLTPKSMALIARSKSEAATSQPTKVSIGTASENPPPPTSHQTIGNDTSAPFADRNEPGNANGRGYAKTQNALGNQHSQAHATTDDGSGFTPDVAAALTDRLATVRPRFNANDNSQTPGMPGRRSPGMPAAQREAAFQRTPGTEPAQERAPANDQHPVAPETKSAGPAPTSGREVSTQMYPEKPAFHDALLQAGYQHDEVPGADGRTYHRYQNEPARAQAEAAEPEHPAMAQLRQARQALQERGATRALQELDAGVQDGTVTPAHVDELARVLADTRAPQDIVTEAKERGQLGEPRPSEYEEPTEPPAVDTRARTDTGAIANSETTARKKNFAAQTADNILQEHKGDLTKTPTPGALRDRISGAMRAYREEMARAGQSTAIPIKGNLSPGQKWLARGAALLRGKLDPARIHSFMTDEFSALHPELGDLTGETDRIEGGIAKSRTSGDAAIAEYEKNVDWKEKAENAQQGWKGEGHNPDVDTAETRGRENIEHTGWSLIDPEDEESRGFTDHELAEMHDRHQLATNMNRADHAAHQEARGTQRQRFNTERSKAERIAEIDPTHVGTPEQRRQAIEAISGELSDRNVADIFKNTDGSLNLNKIRDDFVAAKDKLGDIWQRRLLGNSVVPGRQGKMGSDERALARLVEAAMSTHIAWGGQRDVWAHKLAAAHARTFNHADARRNPKTVGLATYVADRNLKFMDDFENGRPQPTPELQAAADFIRKGMKETYDAEKLMGATSEFRDNYIAHMFEDDATAARFDAWMKDRYGPKWFQKERGYNTIAEARDNGFKLRTDNPMEIYTARMMAGTNFLVKQRILQDMKNYGAAHALADENPIATIEKGWTKVNAPNGEDVMLAPEVMPMWRNAIDREGDLWKNKSGWGSLFRGWMTLKSVWVPLKLALSGFHLGHVAFIHSNAGATFGSAFNGEKTPFGLPKDFQGVVGGAKGRAFSTTQALLTYPAHVVMQPVARGASAVLKKLGPDIFKPVTDPLDAFRDLAHGQHVMDAFNDPNFKRTADDEWNNQLLTEMGLQLQPHALANLRAMQDIAAAVGVRSPKGRLGSIAKFSSTGPSTLSAPMFHLIQMWKATQATTAAAALLRQHPEYVNDELLRRAAMRELGKNIDDLYGEAFHPAKLWGKTFEGLGRGVFLSLDWQAGQVGQFGGAVTNQLRSLGAATGALPKRNEIEQAIFNASPKTSQMVRYVGGAMLMSGLMSYALSGETPEGLDFVYPRVGGLNTDGSPRRISLPQWTREAVMFTKHWGAQGYSAMGAFLAAKELLWSKMVLAPAVHALSNHDFYNREMSDPDAPLYRQIGQMAGSIWGEASAISYESSNQIEREGGSGFEKVLSYAGMPPAPKYIEKTDMDNRIAKNYREGPGAGEKMYVNKERDDEKSALLQKFDMARVQKDFKAATALKQEIVKKGFQKADAVGKYPPGSGSQYMFERLDRAKQLALTQDMTPEEFRKYVTKNPRVARGGQVERELLADWKKTHQYWRG